MLAFGVHVASLMVGRADLFGDARLSTNASTNDGDLVENNHDIVCGCFGCGGWPWGCAGGLVGYAGGDKSGGNFESSLKIFCLAGGDCHTYVSPFKGPGRPQC